MIQISSILRKSSHCKLIFKHLTSFVNTVVNIFSIINLHTKENLKLISQTYVFRRNTRAPTVSIIYFRLLVTQAVTPLLFTYQGVAAPAACCNTCPSWFPVLDGSTNDPWCSTRRLYCHRPRGKSPSRELEVERRRRLPSRFFGSLSSLHRVFIDAAHLQGEPEVSGMTPLWHYTVRAAA